VTDWQGLLDGLTRILPGLPDGAVLQVVEPSRPDEGRFVQAWRAGDVLRVEASGRAPLAGEDLPIHADRLAAAGWAAPEDAHRANWWLELSVTTPGDPQAYGRLAYRIVAALNHGFGIGSPAHLAYRAWRQGTLQRLDYPELGLPAIQVLYHARLAANAATPATPATPDDPSGLLRRLLIGEQTVDQAYGPDRRWVATGLLVEIERGTVADRAVPISLAAAREVMRRWRERAAGPSAGPSTPDGREPGPRPGALRHAREITGKRDAAGNLVAPPDRLDEPERGQVVRYLLEAPVLATAFGFDPDPYQPGQPEVIPLHIHTDGEWVWPESLAYFADRYGFAPDPELLEHSRRRGYRWPDLPKETRVLLARQLRGEPA
jgi:hypothetical protein